MSIIKKIVFTGGGSSGHVTPNLALIERFQQAGWAVVYMGSAQGIEKQLIIPTGIPYYTITSDKLRRYFSWQNFISPFKVLYGIAQAIWLCRRIRPDIVFSKGGFVAFPVVVGAWLNGIPVIAHESDFTPGLANKLTYPFARKVCVTFAETAQFFKTQEKIIVTGTPVRKGFFQGNAARGREICGFNENKKIILVYGGGLGSATINQTIRDNLPRLLENFQIVHLCGKNRVVGEAIKSAGYVPFEYLHDELYDVMACADIVVSRAGANSIYEILTLGKLNVLIPLSAKASRGDQLINAKYCETQGFSKVLPEEMLTGETLLSTLEEVFNQEQQFKETLANFKVPDTINEVYHLVTHMMSGENIK